MAATPQPNESSRRFPRFNVEVPVRVMANKGEQVLIIRARGNNLNLGGLAVSTSFELAIEDSVAIEFTTPYSKNPVRMRAKVRNRRDNSYGLEFLPGSDSWDNHLELQDLLQNFPNLMKDLL